MQSTGERIRRISMTAIECVVRRYSDLEASMASNESSRAMVNWLRRRSLRRADPHGMLRTPRRRRTRMSRLLAKPGILEAMEQYRQSALSRLLCWLWWSISLLLHPTKVWKAAHFWTKIQLWLSFYYNRLTSRYREKKALIEWVRSRVRNYSVPDDFSSGWTDGILLCALLDSMYPGSCPRYDLLNPDNSLSNMQLAFLLIEKHTPIRLDITAEEVVEGPPGIKKAIRSIVAQLKLISAKRDLQKALGRLPNPTSEIQYAPKQECFAKGMGLILAVRGRRATFNVFTRPTHSFCIVVEIRGPNGSVSKQTITNKSPRSKVLRLSDYRDENGMQTCSVLIEYEIFPGKIAVKYRPALTGKHQLSIIWHGQHVMGSPYIINVEDSRDDEEPLTPSPTGSPAPSITNFNDVVREELLRRTQRASAQKSQDTTNQPKVRRRRIIKRVVKCNGKEFVIEGDDKEELKRVLITISNHKGSSRRPWEHSAPQNRQPPVMSPLAMPPKKARDAEDESPMTTPLTPSPEKSALPTISVEAPQIVISTASPPPDERRLFDIACASATLQNVGQNSGVPTSTPVTTCTSLPCHGNYAKTTTELSCLTSPSEEKHERVPQVCDSSTTSLLGNPPEVLVTAFQDTGSGDMPSEVGDGVAFPTDNMKRPPCHLPVIKEETERRAQTGPNVLEGTDVETVGHAAECSTKYEFRIHRSSVTVNIQPPAPSEEVRKNCSKTSVGPTVTSPQSKEETAKNALAENKQPPVSPRTIRRKVLKRQSTACEGSVEDKAVEPLAEPPVLLPCSDADASSPSTVKNMIKSWEKKQQEQISRAESMTQNVTSSTPVIPFIHQSHSSPETPNHGRDRMTRTYRKSESSGESPACTSLKAYPDVYEESNAPAPPARSLWPKIRRCSYRPKLIHTRSYPGATVFRRARELTSSRDPKRVLTPFSRHSKNTSTTKEREPDDEKGSWENTLAYVTTGIEARDPQKVAPLLRTFDGNRNRAGSLHHTMGESLLYEFSQEYIDDEIPNDGTLLLDCYTAFKESKTYSDIVSLIYDADELHELLKASQSHPENCVALGARLYFGQVGTENHFQVDASRAGAGPLSIGIQGPTEGSVVKVSATYSGLGNYTVMYKVAEPGYYIINVRWADWPIPDSPFMCMISA